MSIDLSDLLGEPEKPKKVTSNGYRRQALRPVSLVLVIIERTCECCGDYRIIENNRLLVKSVNNQSVVYSANITPEHTGLPREILNRVETLDMCMACFMEMDGKSDAFLKAIVVKRVDEEDQKDGVPH